MTELLLQLLVPFSALLLVLVSIQKLLLKRLGARTVYALWSAVPLFFSAPLLIPLLPVTFHAEPIKRYQVGVQQLSASVSDVSTIFSVWLVGSVLCAAYLVLSYLSSRAQYRRATPLNTVNIGPAYRQAEDSSGPCVSGLLAPRILLPNDFFTRFDPTQQRLILQHE